MIARSETERRSHRAGKRVLLVSPPWLFPRVPGLAIATLRPLLEQAGIPCDDLHASTLFPYSETAGASVMETFSAYFFVPYLHPEVDREELVARALQRYCRAANIGDIRGPVEQATPRRLGIDPAAFRRNLLRDMERAGECLDRIVARAAHPDYDVIGFSATFESQLPATIALARRLRALRPDLRIVLGGATCFEEQGDGLAASFPELDAVCHTEGEAVIVPLIRALRGELSLAEVPGIAWRDQAGTVHHNPSPPIPRDLDLLPIPDYRGYVAQFQASEWQGREPMRLLFETSRGCWWGQKHLCTFCGLNPEGLSYRFKSSERTYREIRQLYTQYPEAGFLQSTDNILPMSYIKEVMPRLAVLPRDPGRPLGMFFMIKANLRRAELQAIFDGGVTDVQPGVESFHDQILANMDKGVTGIGQVQLIKWATEVGIRMSYNIIVRNPGDRPEWYREMGDLVPYIAHLPPPTGLTPMMLNRFSLYHTYPERYGITAARPREHYRDIYRDPGVDLWRIAYEFEYDHPLLHDEELVLAQRYFFEQFESWRAGYQPDRAFWLDREAGVIVIDRRGDKQQDAVLGGAAADVFRYLDQARTPGAIERRFGRLDPAFLRCLLDTWVRRRWICYLSGRYLVVLPARERRAARQEAAEPARLTVVAA